MIYLDYAATSPALPEMFASQTLFTGGKTETEAARAKITRLLMGGGPAGVCGTRSADPGEIIFTSGGTESDNLAVLGTFFQAKKEGRPCRILTGATEHEAVLESCKAAEAYGGMFGCDVKVQVLPVSEDGAVAPETVREALREIREETVQKSPREIRAEAPLVLVSLMYANNETGVLTDVEEIGRICREEDALFHTDAVQAVGHVPLDLRKLPVSMLSASAHKFGGPKGTGFLYLQKGVRLQPLFFGTEDGEADPSGIRPGTISDAGAAGMAKALSYRTAHLSEENARIGRLRDLLEKGILEGIPGTHRNGRSPRLPGHLNISFDGVESSSLLFLLDMKGVCASGGSACAAQSRRRSHVLTAMGLPEDRINSAIRFSLGPETTDHEIAETLRIVRETVSELRMLRG